MPDPIVSYESPDGQIIDIPMSKSMEFETSNKGVKFKKYVSFDTPDGQIIDVPPEKAMEFWNNNREKGVKAREYNPVKQQTKLEQQAQQAFDKGIAKVKPIPQEQQQQMEDVIPIPKEQKHEINPFEAIDNGGFKMAGGIIANENGSLVFKTNEGEVKPINSVRDAQELAPVGASQLFADTYNSYQKYKSDQNEIEKQKYKDAVPQNIPVDDPTFKVFVPDTETQKALIEQHKANAEKFGQQQADEVIKLQAGNPWENLLEYSNKVGESLKRYGLTTKIEDYSTKDAFTKWVMGNSNEVPTWFPTEDKIKEIQEMDAMNGLAPIENPYELRRKFQWQQDRVNAESNKLIDVYTKKLEEINGNPLLQHDIPAFGTPERNEYERLSKLRNNYEQILGLAKKLKNANIDPTAGWNEVSRVASKIDWSDIATFGVTSMLDSKVKSDTYQAKREAEMQGNIARSTINNRMHELKNNGVQKNSPEYNELQKANAIVKFLQETPELTKDQVVSVKQAISNINYSALGLPESFTKPLIDIVNNNNDFINPYQLNGEEATVYKLYNAIDAVKSVTPTTKTERVMNITAQSVPFMLSFGALGKLTGKALTSLESRLASRIESSFFGKAFTESTAKGISKYTVGTLGIAGQTTVSPMMWKQYFNMQTENPYANKSDLFRRAWLSTFGEILTEKSGWKFDEWMGFSPASNLNELSSGSARMIKSVDKFTHAIGMNSVISEELENLEGDLKDYIMTGKIDLSFGALSEEAISTAVMVGAPAITKQAIQSGAYKIEKNKARKAYVKSEVALPASIKDPLINAMAIKNDAQRNAEMDRLTGIVYSMDKDGLDKTFNYIKNKTIYDTIRAGEKGQNIDLVKKLSEVKASSFVNAYANSDTNEIILAEDNHTGEAYYVKRGQPENQDGTLVVINSQTGESKQVKPSQIKIVDRLTGDEFEMQAIDQKINEASLAFDAQHAKEDAEDAQISAQGTVYEVGEEVYIDGRKARIQGETDGQGNYPVVFDTEDGLGESAIVPATTIKSTPTNTEKFDNENISENQQPTINTENQQAVTENQPTALVVSETAPHQPKYPTTKDGSPDFDAMNEEQLIQEMPKIFGVEKSKSIIQSQIKREKDTLKRLDKKQAKSINEEVKLENEKEVVKSNIKRLESVIFGLTESSKIVPTKTERKTQKVKAENIAEIKDNYQQGHKEYGRNRTLVLESGKEVKGRYVVIEAGLAVPSHDPFTFTQTKGFPTTETGTTVNNRDYEKDENAQQKVIIDSNDYDARGLQNTIFVTKDGIVVSGNNRTMSRIRSAQQGTDTKYKESLKQESDIYGISPEKINSFDNPQLVFELEETPEYTTEMFSEYNIEGGKKQNTTEKAVSVSKTINNAVVKRIGDMIDSFDTLSDFYSDSKAITDTMTILVTEGVIQSNDVTALMNTDKSGLSAQGKEFFETLMIGAVLDEQAIRRLDVEGMRNIRTKIVKNIVVLMNNAKLKEYNLKNEISEAINLIDEITRQNMPIDMYLNSANIFEQKGYTSEAIYFAMLLKYGKESSIKASIKAYNQMAELSEGGQIDIFTGKPQTKEEILNSIKTLVDEDTRQTIEKAITSIQKSKIANAYFAEGNARARGEISGTTKQINTVEPQQGEQTDRINQEANVTTAETETGGGDSVVQSRKVEEEVTKLTPKEIQEQSLLEERKQRILSEGSGFDKPFGLIPVSEIKSASDIQSNVEKIITTLKENEGNKSFDLFNGFSNQGKNYAKNAGEQVREYMIALDVLPNELRKKFADNLGVKTFEDISKWGESRYKELKSQPKSETEKKQSLASTFGVETPLRKQQREALDQLQSKAKNALPVVVVNNMHEFIEAISKDNTMTKKTINDAKQKAKDGYAVSGLRTSNAIYINLEAHKDTDGVIKTWLHEQVGHAGIFSLFPNNEDQLNLFTRIFDDIGADEIKSIVGTQYESIFANKTPEQQKVLWAMEYVARIAEKLDANEALTPVEQSTWDKILNYINDLLKAISNNTVKWTEAEVLELAKVSARKLAMDLPKGDVEPKVKIFELIENEGEWKVSTSTYKRMPIANSVYGYMDKKTKREYDKLRDKAETYGTKLDAEQNLSELNDFVDKHTDIFDKAIKSIDKQEAQSNFNLVKQDPKLVVVHNIKPSGVLNVDKIGGLPMPSLAIVDVNTGFTGYGDITLIADKDLIDPKKDKNVKVFGADVYSPRYPSVTYDIPIKGLRLLDKKINSINNRDLESYVLNQLKNKIQERGIDDLLNSTASKVLFLKDNSYDFEYLKNEVRTSEKVMEDFIKKGLDKIATYEITDNDKIKKQLTDLYLKQNVADKKIIREEFIKEDGFLNENLMRNFLNEVQRDIRIKDKVNESGTAYSAERYVRDNNLQAEYEKYINNLYDAMGVEEKIFKGYTPSGTRKYVPHNIDNVIKEMKSAGLRAGESFSYGGLGDLRATFTPQFKSIKDIQNNKGLLQDNIDQAKNELEKEMDELQDKLLPFFKYDRLDGQTMTEELATLAIRGYSESFNRLDTETLNAVREFADKLRNMPTTYFEAKITRAVDLGEFKTALVPTDTSDKVKNVLKNKGLQIVEYTDEVDRKSKLNQESLAQEAQFNIIGEQGATALDKAEEATTRLDNLAIAKEMENANKTSQEIRLATGWEKGVDGKWRYEILDGEIKKPFPTKNQSWGEIYDANIKNGKFTKLSDIYDGEVLNSYPELKDLSISIQEGDGASFNKSKSNEPSRIDIGRNTPMYKVKSSLIHEIQHAIQDIEGFAKGGNENVGKDIGNKRLNEAKYKLNQFIYENDDKSDAELEKMPEYQKLDNDVKIAKLESENGYINYSRLSGEVEARNAQTRMNMTAEERLNTLLTETADVDPQDQIVIMDALGAMNLETKPTDLETIKQQAITDGTFMKAPNGKPTNLNERQWLQVRTPEFMNWFGNWINDPENASKVVDDNGEPLVVYHGTNKKIKKVNMKKGSQGIFWFTDNKQAIEEGNVGASAKGVIMEMFANIKNPADWDAYEKLALFQFESRGYDGALLKDTDGTTGFIFEPNQIKSATANVGTFSPSDANIMFNILPDKDAERLDALRNTEYIETGETRIDEDYEPEDPEYNQRLVMKPIYTNEWHYADNTDPDIETFDNLDEALSDLLKSGDMSDVDEYYEPVKITRLNIIPTWLDSDNNVIEEDSIQSYEDWAYYNKNNDFVKKIGIDSEIDNKSFDSVEESARNLENDVYSNISKYIIKNYNGYSIYTPDYGKYRTIVISDVNDDAVGYIQLRIADHTYNPSRNTNGNNFISVEISNRFKGKFSRGAYSLPFNGDDTIDDVAEAINERVMDIIDSNLPMQQSEPSFNIVTNELTPEQKSDYIEAKANLTSELKAKQNELEQAKNELEAKQAEPIEVKQPQTPQEKRKSVLEAFTQQTPERKREAELKPLADKVNEAEQSVLQINKDIESLENKTIEKARNEVDKRVDGLFNILNVSEIGFYSTVEKALNTINQDKGTKEQFKKMLLNGGAKQAELDWMSFDELPEKLTKSDIQNWIDGNRIEVKEVVKGQLDTTQLNKISQESYGKDYNQLTSEQKQTISDMTDEESDSTKYSQYVLPGGENYKELLLTMPAEKKDLYMAVSKMGRKANGSTYEYFEVVRIDDPSQKASNETFDTIDKANQKAKTLNANSANQLYDNKNVFKSSHFDEPNILAHVRFDEREVNGERVLFIEEFQSDWAQKGKKEGFGKSVPDMPFKKTDQWLNLAFRRMMKYAVDNGFDRIAWTNGKQQSDRYSLAKQVDKIEITQREVKGEKIDSYRAKTYKDGNLLEDQDYIPFSNLEGMFGKEIAQKVYNGETVFEGEGLEVGGTGMKAFYDNIVPSAVNKLAKPFGAKVETIDMDGEPQQSIAITDKMTDSISQGVPMFRIMDENATDKQKQQAEELLTKLRDEVNMLKGVKDKVTLAIQDRFLPVKRLIEDIEKITGEKIKSNEDVYHALERYSSAVRGQMDIFIRDQHKPMVDVIGSLTKKYKLAESELEDYVLAKHSLERHNGYPEKGIEGTSALSEDGTTDWNFEVVNQIIKDFEAKVDKDDIKLLWKQINNATDFTLETLKNGGIISLEEYKNYKSRWKYYVPLRGWDLPAELDEKIQMYTEVDKDGIPHSNRTYVDATKRAKGRNTKADSPFQYIYNTAYSSIVTAEKNKAKQHLLNLARNNKNLEGIFDTTSYQVAEEQTDAEGKTVKIWKEISPDKVDADFYKKKEEGLARTTLNKDSRDFIRYTPTEAQKAHQVEVYDNGNKYIINIKQSDLASALNQNNTVRVPWIDDSVGRVTRFLSANFTALNPDFIPVNFVRDLQYAYWASAINDSRVGVLELTRQLPKASGALHRYITGKSKPETNKEDALMEAYLKYGGKTGFVYMKSLDKIKKQIDKEIKQAGGQMSEAEIIARYSVLGGIGKPAYQAVNYALNYGSEWSENISRLAIFMGAVNKGYTYEESADQAKNITVNFNRKGTLGGVIGSLMAFFNASTQGVFNLAHLLWDNKKAGAKAITFMMLSGYVWQMIARSMAGDDDQGNNYYDLLSDYEKQNNIVVFFGEGKEDYFKLPLPQGFRVFFGMGQTLSNLTTGKVAVQTGMLQLLDELLNGFSPINMELSDFAEMDKEGRTFGQNVVQVARPITPTSIVPFLDLMVNRNYFGNSIYRENLSPNKTNVTNVSLGKKNVNPSIKKSMEFLNELTGGDKYKKGWWDWNPSALEYLGEYLGGGRLKFYNRMMKMTSQLWNDDVELEVKDYPIANRFFGKRKEYDYSKDYSETNAKILSEQGTFVDYQKDPEYKDKANEIKSNNRVVRMKTKRGEPVKYKLVAYDQMLKTEKKIKDLYKSITPENEKEIMELINNLKKEYILDYNKIYKTK